MASENVRLVTEARLPGLLEDDANLPEHLKADSLAGLADQADTARDEAVAALASMQKGQPGGTAALDGTGAVPEAQLPARLSESALSASNDETTAANVNDRATQTGEALGFGFNAMPKCYLDGVSLANGAVTGLTFGDLSASFGNSPASVSGDRVTMAPTTGSNSAAYIQADTGGPCRRIGMEFEIPTSGDGTVAIVIPNVSWASGIVNAGLHATVTAAGVVSSGRNVGGTNTGTQTTRVGPLTGIHTVEALLDDVRTEITVLLDGVEVLRYTDATAFTMLSDFAIWELFQANGTSGVPSFIRSAWADTRSLLPVSARGTRIERVRKNYADMFSTSASLSPSTTYREVLAIGTLGVYFPPSGRLLCRYRVWISANTMTSTKRLYGSIASAADQALMFGGQLGPAVCEVIVTGTPGALQVLSPQMWMEGTPGGSVTATISGSVGVATMSAIALEAVV